MKLRYLEEARQDIAWWRIYYRRNFPEGKQSATLYFRATEKLLLQHPEIGMRFETGEGRKLNIPRTPFAFIYEVKKDVIEIVRIYDMRQQGTEGFQEE